MQVIIFLLSFNVLATFVTAQTDKTTSGPLHRVKRVVGGYPSDVRNLPYMVNIRKRRIFVCGGVLLTPRCVLTAAHCVKDTDPWNLLIRGGVTYLDDTRNSRNVNKIYMPAHYDRISLNNDIAMLQLQAPLRGPNIGTIRLAETAPRPGEFIKVTGWGLTSDNAQQLPNQMHSVYVRVMEQTKCRALYQGYRNITDAMFCASVPGLRDACSADSGGPAVIYDRLVGIVSWGKVNRCADALAPGVYVNVVHMRQWIETTLRQYFF